MQIDEVPMGNAVYWEILFLTGLALRACLRVIASVHLLLDLL